jgi:hypothetical protein
MSELLLAEYFGMTQTQEIARHQQQQQEQEEQTLDPYLAGVLRIIDGVIQTKYGHYRDLIFEVYHRLKLCLKP